MPPRHLAGALLLAGPGRMPLTLYALHVLALALLERVLRPGEPPYGAGGAGGARAAGRPRPVAG